MPSLSFIGKKIKIDKQTISQLVFFLLMLQNFIVSVIFLLFQMREERGMRRGRGRGFSTPRMRGGDRRGGNRRGYGDRHGYDRRGGGGGRGGFTPSYVT